MISSMIPQKSLQAYWLLLSLAAFALLTVAHAYVTVQGEWYIGSLLILDHLFNIGVVLALLTLCTAVGLWTLARFRFTFDKPLDALLFSVSIGCGMVSVSILILGFLSGLQPMILAGLMALWVVLARSEIVTVFRFVAQAINEVKEQANVLSLTVFGIVAVFMIAQALLLP